MVTRRNISVSKETIIEYWKNNIQELEINIKPNWNIAHEHCWICGMKSKLQRCHIIYQIVLGEIPILII